MSDPRTGCPDHAFVYIGLLIISLDALDIFVQIDLPAKILGSAL